MAVYWALLLMDCARDVKNTRGLTHEGNRLRENSHKAKVWKQSRRPTECGGSTERLGTRSLSLGERDAQQRLGHCGLSSPRGKRLLKQLWCFKVADSLSSANCCFKAVLLRRLSNNPTHPTSGLKGSYCTLISFLYCTFKHDSVSVICKNKDGRPTANAEPEICHVHL